jgi:ATP-dependent helicase/nuclease subunit A
VREEKAPGKMSASEIGSAHHAFLEGVSLAEVGGVARLKTEAERLRGQGQLSDAEAACLDFKALADFWQSEVGGQILSQRENARRELPFTARFSPAELAEFGGGEMATKEDGEFIVVQGVVDLAVVLPGEIWVLDFKTDHFAKEELAVKVNLYRLQLALYGNALARIFRRPVTREWLHFLAIGQTVALAG